MGMIAFRHGRRSSRPATLGLGVVLMFYPYFISNTVALYLVGAALCAGIWFDHR